MKYKFPIIEKLGGRRRVFDFLIASKDEKRRTINSLIRWEDRGSLPGDVVPLLMKMAEDDGVKYTSDDFKAVQAIT